MRGRADSIAFVCDASDELACELMASYAPIGKRFGYREVDGVHVFALAFVDAMTLLNAPDHAGERETQIAIMRALWQREAGFGCVCFAFGAVVLVDVGEAEWRALS